MAKRWMSLVAAIFIQACSGVGYTFAIYSPPLKDVCGYNQKQLATLGTIKDIGENFGMLSGLLVDLLPTSVILLIGVAQAILGYGGLWLIASGHLAPPPFPIMGLLMGVASNSSSWFNTAVLVTIVRNFSRRRGDTVGVLKGFLGLSGAILTQIYTAFYAPHQEDYLFMVALMPSIVVVLSMIFIQPVAPSMVDDSKEERSKFHFIYKVCLALAAYLFVVTIIQSRWQNVHRKLSTLIFAGMVLLLSLFFVVPLRTAVADPPPGLLQPLAEPGPSVFHGRSYSEPVTSGGYAPLSSHCGIEPASSSSIFRSGSSVSGMRRSGGSFLEPIEEKPRVRNALGEDILLQSEDEEESDEENESPPPTRRTGGGGAGGNIPRSDSKKLLALGEGAVRRSRKGPRRGEDFTLAEAVVKADFWLLFWGCVCGCGSGLTAINNLAQMGEAQGYDNVRIFVALVSIWNFLGRLGAGRLSERLIKKHVLPRPVTLLGAQVLMVVGHLLFAFAVPGSLYIGSMIVGVCYGAHWAIMPATASELFGLKSFGVIYNFFAMANPLGSYLFSSLLAGYIYDREALKGAGNGIASTLGSHTYHHHFHDAPPFPTNFPKIPSGTWLNHKDEERWPMTALVSGARRLLLVDSPERWGATIAETKRYGKEAASLTWSIASSVTWPAFIGALGGGEAGWGAFGPAPAPAPGPGLGPKFPPPLAPPPTPGPVPGDEPMCVGAHCFKLTFLMMSLVCCLGVILNTILVVRTRPVYANLYDKNKKRPLLD